MNRYLLLKRSPELSSKPHAPITIVEFQAVLSRFPQVLWAREAAGMFVRDSIGVHKMPPMEGVSFRDKPDHIHFVYPFYGGIAVHLDGNPELIDLCDQLAELLNARVFGIS